MPSARFIDAVAAANTDEQPVALVTVTHADFGGPLRWCTGGADIVSRGFIFAARPMTPVPPGESADGRPSAAKLVVDNIEPDAVGAFRSITAGRPSVLIEVVLAATPDTVEQTWPGLQIVASRPAADSIECDIAERDDGEEIWPLQAFTPGSTPGLY
ncbi:MAG TPA: DUF1833 family protein [Vitreimonas sp.]|uniref:DUF1833 family protein n=1 Tax=Vitreimonas sp. TaxID=3069702 RepID=UPI002D665896|nr:DUF1833 family protein [Vitreimonas sp.]HYD87108.1 DUF1833 family protein [Vitreimonas sp.]